VFDVSFSELLVIAVVALLVIGPEKLPKVARTVGAFVGRMQRYMAQVKEEVNREMRFEELQKLQQEIKQSVEQESAALQANIHAPSGHVKKMNVTPKPKKIVKVKSTAVKTSAQKPKVTAAKRIKDAAK
jgi:sec-independent protein translocase protein TatB